MPELETTGWQIPEKSGWTLYVGLLMTGEPPSPIPWLYLHKPEVQGVLPLARFRTIEHAQSTVSFINAMFGQITRAIAIAQIAVMDENAPDEEAGGDTCP